MSDLFPHESFHAVTNKILAKQTLPFALQIGAMDGVKFDLLHPHLSRGGWRGLLVEPVGDMFSALQNTYTRQPHLQLVNCAIGDHDGFLTLRRIAPIAVTAGLVGDEALGMTTSMDNRSPLNNPKLLARFPEVRDRLLIETTAPCLTLPSLLDRYAVTAIDLMMIDTEGADWMIARQLDLARYAPQLICLEHTSLSETDRSACVMHFLHHGYRAALCEEDRENYLFMRMRD